MSSAIRKMWQPGSLQGADGVAEAVAAKDLNNLYRTSCYFADSERYVAFCALYAVMRIVDDRIDDVLARGCIPDEANRERGVLDAWQRLITALLEGEPPDDHDITLSTEPRARQLLDAFSKAYRQFPVDRKLWRNFFSAMREDLQRTRFQAYQGFLEYATGATVAPTTVYLYLLAAERGSDGVFRVPRGFDLDRCGHTLGLFAYIVHVLRDIRQDLSTGDKGLLYLAADDMARHGVSEAMLFADLASGSASPPVRSLVRDLVERARTMLKAGRETAQALEGRLSPDRAFVLELIIRIYAQTIDKIVSCAYDTMTNRHRLTDAEKEHLALEVAAGAHITRA